MQLECRLPGGTPGISAPFLVAQKVGIAMVAELLKRILRRFKTLRPAGSYTNKYGPRLMFRNDSYHIIIMKHAFEPNLESFLVQGEYQDKVGIQIKNHDL